MHRLEQVYGYRSYAYMKRRWEQYCKRLTRQQRAYANAGWEETLDLILDFPHTGLERVLQMMKYFMMTGCRSLEDFWAKKDI